MTPSPVPQAETGRIGRFSLVARVGEGGMGVVHLARDPNGAEVALKVLRPHVVGDDEGRARLAREVSSLRRVRSPRVAEVYDADPWGERPYLVTRYVEGPSLHDRVRESGPLEGEDLRGLAVGLMEAVMAVHEAEVLHRDIKPSNVLIEGAHDPVLIDFGLAKVSDDSRLTATGWLMGTPGYLAPEVLYGDDASTAADVHSWAATVTYAATGDSPFGRGPSMAVMDRARRGEHDLAHVPPWLRPILAACLAPDPADRPSAHEVMRRLEGTSLPVAPPAPGTRPITVARPQQRPESPPLSDPSRRARTPVRSSRPLRMLLMVGLLALFATAVALAPYVSAAVSLVVVWLVRTASWSMDAMADRRATRGERRSDSVVRVLSAPWYLVVAALGTVVLMVAVCLAAAVPALVLLAAGVSETRSLLVGGLLGGLTLWWGPGSRRLRRPTRRLVWRAGQAETAGVVAVGLVLGAVVVLMVTAGSTGVLWWPDDGPPFDPGVLVPPGFR